MYCERTCRGSSGLQATHCTPTVHPVPRKGPTVSVNNAPRRDGELSEYRKRFPRNARLAPSASLHSHLGPPWPYPPTPRLHRLAPGGREAARRRRSTPGSTQQLGCRAIELPLDGCPNPSRFPASTNLAAIPGARALLPVSPWLELLMLSAASISRHPMTSACVLHVGQP